MQECQYELTSATARLLKDGRDNGFNRSLCLSLATIDPALTNDIGPKGFTPDASQFNEDQVRDAVNAYFSDGSDISTEDLISELEIFDAEFDALNQSVSEFVRRIENASRDDVTDMLIRIVSRSGPLTEFAVGLLSLEEKDALSVTTELSDPHSFAEVKNAILNLANNFLAYPTSKRQNVLSYIEAAAQLKGSSGEYFQTLTELTLPVLNGPELEKQLASLSKDAALLRDMLIR